MAKRDTKAIPKKKPASRKKPPRIIAQMQRRIKKAEKTIKKLLEHNPAAVVGGLQSPKCTVCGKEIGPEDSYEVRLEDNARIHRPACKV